VAAGEINDAEPGVRQADTLLGVKPGIVRPAMRKHPDHALKGFRRDGRSIDIEHSCYAAHGDSHLGTAPAQSSGAAGLTEAVDPREFLDFT